MEQIIISCPHCGFSKNVEKTRIPDQFKSVRCPLCGKSFQQDLATKNVTLQAQNGTSLQPVPRRLGFTFTGSAREYFGIWIINTLLKIVTLGIYSPWAKVRKRRYFYGNTQLEDANFDYLANPIALLKGWLLGAALFISYSVGSHYSPIVGMVFGLLFFLLIPWVIVRSRLFNNRNSAHRNVRFDFRPAYREAYQVYAWLPILSVFTLGLLMPYIYYRQKRFQMENNAFGQNFFSFDAQLKDFYLLSLKIFGIAVVCFGSVLAVSIFGFVGMSPLENAMPVMIGVVFPIMSGAGYFFLIAYAYVRTSNLSWNGTCLDKNRFSSTMRVRDMIWIMFSNLTVSILSFGLLIPWASVRLARYRLENLELQAVDDLDDYLNVQREKTSAVGEEIGDIFGVEFGIL